MFQLIGAYLGLEALNSYKYYSVSCTGHCRSEYTTSTTTTTTTTTKSVWVKRLSFQNDSTSTPAKRIFWTIYYCSTEENVVKITFHGVLATDSWQI